MHRFVLWGWLMVMVDVSWDFMAYQPVMSPFKPSFLSMPPRCNAAEANAKAPPRGVVSAEVVRWMFQMVERFKDWFVGWYFLSWHPSHFILFHLISSHFISFHLISSHFYHSAMPMSLNLCQKQTKLGKSITLTSQISLVILRLLHVLLLQMHQLAPTQQAAMLGFQFVFKPFQGYIELGLIWKKLLPPIQISQYRKKNPSKLQWSNQFTGKTVLCVLCLASNSGGVYQNQTTFRMFLAHF